MTTTLGSPKAYGICTIDCTVFFTKRVISIVPRRLISAEECPVVGLVLTVLNLQDLSVLCNCYGELKLHLQVYIVAMFLFLIRTMFLCTVVTNKVS
jgi:hypothetical protein